MPPVTRVSNNYACAILFHIVIIALPRSGLNISQCNLTSLSLPVHSHQSRTLERCGRFPRAYRHQLRRALAPCSVRFRLAGLVAHLCGQRVGGRVVAQLLQGPRDVHLLARVHRKQRRDGLSHQREYPAAAHEVDATRDLRVVRRDDGDEGLNHAHVLQVRESHAVHVRHNNSAHLGARP